MRDQLRFGSLQKSCRFVGHSLAWRILGLAEALERRVLLAGSTAGDSPPELGSSFFVENTGQLTDPSIRFALQESNANIVAKDNGLYFQLFRPDRSLRSRTRLPAENTVTPPALEQTELSIQFPQSNSVRPVGRDQAEVRFNYFVGETSSWRKGLPGYEKIEYPNLYDGIDLYTWGHATNLKYEFHLAPASDYTDIRLRYSGIRGLSVDADGRLRIATQFGDIFDDAPIVYQESHGVRTVIPSEFLVIDDHTYGFQVLGSVDPNRELVIDPRISWASYLGGTGTDYGHGIAIDSEGSAWVTGQTASTDFHPGGWDPTYNKNFDVFVAKIHADGSLAWGTYLGGSGGESGSSIAIDNDGAAWLVGTTSSTNFPGGGFDQTANGGQDAFVAKLNTDGSLAWGTYLGGSGWDAAHGIAIDQLGRGWIVGQTASSNIPIGSKVSSYHGGSYDGYVTVLASSGTLDWGQYVGGLDYDAARAIAINHDGDAWVVGTTRSTDLAVGGFDTTIGGEQDTFVVKLNSTGNSDWTSYLGGSAEDQGYSIALDGRGDAWLTGYTLSGDFPGGGFDGSYNGGSSYGDAYVAKILANGAFGWGTYLGGSDDDVGYGIAVDGAGNPWITGGTRSTDFPGGGFDPSNDGTYDAFVAKVNATGSLAWGSYYGGYGADYGRGISCNGSTEAWIVGETTSTNLPAGGFSPSLRGATDAFLVRIYDWPDVLSTPSRPALGLTSDSGLLGDGITKSRRPVIEGTAEPLSRVRLFDGNVLLGETRANLAACYSFVPSSDFAEGNHHIRAVAVSDNGTVTDFSPSLEMQIDSSLSATWAFEYDVVRQGIRLEFSEPMLVLPPAEELSLLNVTDNSVFPSSSLDANLLPAIGSASYRLAGGAPVLPDGDYVVSVSSSEVMDVAGNSLPLTNGFRFFFLQGDANRDRLVDTADFNVLAGHFGKGGETFSSGDFDYDQSVTSQDFDILVAQYGQRLVIPQLQKTAATMAERTNVIVGPGINPTDRMHRDLYDDISVLLGTVQNAWEEP